MPKLPIYVFLCFYFLYACSYKPPVDSTSPSFDEPEVFRRTPDTKISHDQNCHAISVREDILNSYHYLIAEDTQKAVCEALYETGYHLDTTSLLEEGVVEDKIEAVDTVYKGFRLKDKVTIGLVVATTVIGLLISYEIYRRSTKNATKKIKNHNIKKTETELKSQLSRAKKKFIRLHDAQVFRDDLENIWKSAFQIQSTELWLLKAEILDEVDRLVDSNPSKIFPIKFESYPDFLTETPENSHYIPLVEYDELGYFTETIENLDALSDKELEGNGISRADLDAADKMSFVDVIENHGGVLFLKETSKVGAVIDTIYKANGVFGKIAKSKFLLKTLTRFLGWTSRMKASSSSIAKKSIGLGISPYELIETEDGDRIYRGPKYLFGKKINEYAEFNDFFIRDLTPKAREGYMRLAKHKTKGLLTNYQRASDGNVSAIVISNADARLRFTELKEGEINRPQKIVGKVLNAAAAEAAVSQVDNPVYYGDEYDFRVSDSFLVELDEQGKRKSRYIDNQSLSNDEKNKLARLEILGLLYDDMDKRGVIQVTQRLAPADIHNYTASVNGTALNQSEAVTFLEKHFEEIGGSEEQLARLTTLKAIFSGPDAGEQSATIDISGSQYSVSTEAISHKPNILAQNSRKVMMLKHEGTNVYSIHVFIGATGVDQVNIDEMAVNSAQGDSLGNMAFGTDAQANKLAAGKAIGRFPVNGSTVQSFYFTDDFELLPNIEAYNQAFGNKSYVPEIRAKMGDPILQMKKSRLDSVTANLFAEDIAASYEGEFIWTESKVKSAITEKYPGQFGILESDYYKQQAKPFLKKIVEAGEVLYKRRKL